MTKYIIRLLDDFNNYDKCIPQAYISLTELYSTFQIT